MRVPCLTLFVNRRSGDWLVQTHAVDATSKFTVATGDPTLIQADRVGNSGAESISDCLKKFGEVVRPAPSTIDQLPSAKKRRFFMDHAMLNVAQPRPELIELHLMKPKDGGFMGDASRRINLSSPKFKSDLIEAVLQLVKSS